MKFSLFVLLFLLTVSSHAQKNNPACASVKNGNFITTKYTTHITRVDSLQIETDHNGQNVDSFRVKWINDCKYTLKFIGGSEKTRNSGIEIITVEILNIKKDSIFIRASIPSYNIKPEFVMIKTK